MEEIIYHIESISIALIFAVLGFFSILLYIPKKEDYRYYRYSRYTLGAAFFVMATYWGLKGNIGEFDAFTRFSYKMIFSLAFSWLTYGSFLFIIYAERYKRKRFFLDGIIPISLMCIFAFIGLKHPHLQEINSVIFGIVFALKCLWMASTCFKEYRKCTKDLDNYYDVTPDISWMKSVLLVSYLLSVFTIVHFYAPATHIIYYPLLLVCYVYLTMKIINYIPEKISRIRQQSVLEVTEPEPEAEKRKPAADIKSKLEAPVMRWIEEKKFTRPNLTIKDVATDIGTNHNYLSKYLNSVMGQTFTVWLHTLRIEESKLLLNDPAKLPIEEIGKRVGIGELYNYSRWFKIITGVSPQQYRKQNR